jgi:CDK inhibitor PHO81
MVSDAFLSLYQPKLTLWRVLRKFGKQIQKRQLEVPEYAASFVNYKALKKVRRSELPL